MDKYNNFSQTVQKGVDESVDFSCFDIAQTCHTNADIMRILTENDEEIKPFAIINLKSIENKKEADILLSHLICHDGRIREAVSFILDEIGEDKFYCDEKSIDILIKGLLDINPNVVRFLISFIAKSKKLKTEIAPCVIAKTKEILEKLEIYSKVHYVENSLKSKKNHAKNRLTFNLYWLLETISVLEEFFDIQILTKTSSFIDYTIREKTALILSKMDNPPIELLRKLKDDKNIYVKNQLL